MELAKRIGSISPSPTLAINAKAKSMRASGIDVLNFGVGEPDFDTPRHIKEAAVKAIEEGFTKYTEVAGIPELKEAIIHKFQSDNGLSYDPSEILVSCGGKHTLYNLAQVLFEEGDEVIVPAPYWVSYPPIITLSGAKPVIIRTTEDTDFKLNIDDLKNAITPKTKGLILNSPSNPTGSVYSKQELEEIAQIAMEYDFYIISDDIYEKIVFDGINCTCIATLGPEIKSRTFIINGVSKTYAMTGWRIGYMAGSAEVISAATRIQSQSTSNPNSIAQKAAVEAILGPQDHIKMMVEEFEKRRNYFMERLSKMGKVRCFKPQGAFYAFPNFSVCYNRSFKGRKISGSLELADFLLEEARVAVVPGIAFGEDNCIRFSLATSMEHIKKGLDRIEEALFLIEMQDT